MAGKSAAPGLTKQKTLKAFEVSKQGTMNAMKKQLSMQSTGPTNGNPMDLMIEQMVDQAKIDDELWLAEGIRND